jgi:hypothetical protein
MHDVISDILANPAVPRNRKRAEIVRAARLFRDDTSYLMPVSGWLTMAREMGIENMGGPAVGFTSAFPTKTVTYGAVMEHDEQTGRMVGMKVGEMTGEHAGMQHGAGAGADTAMAGMDHSRMNMSGAPSARDSAAGAMDHAAMRHGAGGRMAGADTSMAGMDSSMMADMHAMHMRMMADPVIRQRMLADTAMRRMMTEMMENMPADHRAEMERLMKETPAARARQPQRQRQQTRQQTAKPAAPKPAPKPAEDPHAGHRPPR